MPAKRIFFPRKSLTRNLFSMSYLIAFIALVAKVFIFSANAEPSSDNTDRPAAESSFKAESSPLNPNSCAPVTKGEIQLAFPWISEQLYEIGIFTQEEDIPFIAIIWGLIPPENQDPKIYNMFDNWLDSVLNGKDNKAPASADGVSSTVPSLVSSIANSVVPQLSNMKLVDVIKGMVRGNLAPEQNRTIRQLMAQIVFLTDEPKTDKYSDILTKLKNAATPLEKTPTDGSPAGSSNLTIPDVSAAQKSIEATLPNLKTELETLAFSLGTPDLASKVDDFVKKKYIPAYKIQLSTEEKSLWDQFIADLRAVTLPPCTMQTPPAEGKMCFCTDPNQKNCKWKPKAGNSDNVIK